MSIGGGLVPSEEVPQGTRHPGYQDVGDGKWAHLPHGLNLAKPYKKGDTVPPGYCVINIEHGAQLSDTGPVPVTHGTHSVVIPRGTDRLVPIGHVNILNDAVETHYFQGDITQQMSARHNRRFNFQVKQWPKTGDHVGTEITKENLEDSIKAHEVIDLNQDE
tara:strand:- start:733 stop:1218 length:486 start_codon:yes stop_codon:yes gene_type:complete